MEDNLIIFANGRQLLLLKMEDDLNIFLYDTAQPQLVHYIFFVNSTCYNYLHKNKTEWNFTLGKRLELFGK
jgi:hypothetical protein